MEEFLTVSQLNQFIKDVLNAGFPQALWVCGEIQGYDRNKDKKHVFFELVEKDSESHEVKARISVVIFAGRKEYIAKVLKSSENAFELKDDIEVKFLCQVDFYAPHGAVRLSVENIDPVHTLGKMAQQRQRLIAFLKEKGVLEQNKKLDLALVPLNIGLITSYDSAAYNDFIAELKKSGFAFKIFLRNTLMQGKRAEKDVCRGLDILEKIKGLDVLVITRGGGSIAELSCFDSQLIAERVAKAKLPVLSGIGHEINTTITDLAAHTYAKTPTAIAQLLVSMIEQYLSNLQEGVMRVLELAGHNILHHKKELHQNAITLYQDIGQYLKHHEEKLIKYKEFIRHQSVFVVLHQKEELHLLKGNLFKNIQHAFKGQNERLKNLEKMIALMHPRNTLKRGFSVTRNKEGKVIRSLSGINVKDSVTTEVIDGKIESLVQSLIKER